jgi:hypothetical protein
MTLQQLFGIEWPIVRAPMASAQGSALTVAVSNAGALGSLPCALLGPDAMRSELLAIKAQTDRPFNVNFFCPSPAAAVAPLRAKAEAQGSDDFSPLWAVQNASGCKALPAAELTRELASAFR